ncbi:P-loop containing nucleoside triphosphate hydrolase protein [Hypoxylon crocopeplum]|nr:P-loop containing nucleoside triphosphate hydrolase protein [Hypoxylon crocopeplum]
MPYQPLAPSPRALNASAFPNNRSPQILQILKKLLSQNISIDLSRVSTILALFGFASAATGSLKRYGSQVYAWIQTFFMATITVPAGDDLYDEIQTWLDAHALKNREYRNIRAGIEYPKGNRGEIKYQVPFEPVWFLYERRIFVIKKIRDPMPRIYKDPRLQPEEYVFSVDADMSITITTLGRSTEPIRRFLNTCRNFSKSRKESTVTVRAYNNSSYRPSSMWYTLTQKPLRHLDSVHLDEDIKDTLVSDITKYLDPKTRAYYRSRNIPYRRGYLLHGPPGTGKTSLSMALAGAFGLDLHMLDINAVQGDKALENLFRSLPSPSLVLLEDIDAIGLKKRVAGQATAGERIPPHTCTLSGLLNALDGVASSEGRILLMTSNMPHQLDDALLRPGRIDRMIYLGHISQHSAMQMYQRMYEGEFADRKATGGHATTPLMPDEEKKDEGVDPDLVAMASKFASQIPEDTLTPAQVQEYLLRHTESAAEAEAGVAGWVAEQIGRSKGTPAA